MLLRRRFLAISAVCGIALVLAEVAIRVVLFSGSSAIRTTAGPLGDPRSYYDARSEDEYWLLRRVSGVPSGEVVPELLDSRLGWIDGEFDRSTSRPRGFVEREDARAVLLFGDSFARCMPEGMPCFEALLAQSELGASHELVNYGVRGYGLDQVALLVEHVLPSWSDRRPLVVIGVLVDDDLDRCRLRLRGSPKPRFVVREGGVELETQAVPTIEEFVASHPLPRTSYLARLVLRRVARDDHRDEIEAVTRGVLARLRTTLSAFGCDAFFLLFHDERSVTTSRDGDWREAFLVEELQSHGDRFVSTKRAFAGHVASGGTISDAFLHEGDSAGHYSALGNRVAFEALVDGLRGNFESR